MSLSASEQREWAVLTDESSLRVCSDSPRTDVSTVSINAKKLQ